MRNSRQSLRLSLVAMLACVAACRGASDDGGATKANVPAPAAPADDPEAIVPAATAANVSGAFLAGCSLETASTFLTSEADARNVAACILQTPEKAIATVESVTIEAVRTNGTRYVPEIVAKEVSQTPWQIGVRVPSAEVAALDRFELTYNEAGKTPAKASTDDFYFPWKAFPVFHEFVAQAREFIALFRTFRQYGFDEVGLIAAHVSQGAKFHFGFVTQELFDGNLGGIEGANAICTAAGQAIFPDRAFYALLSDSKATAKSRVPFGGDLLLYSGVGHSPDKIWDVTKHDFDLVVTEKGHDSGRVIFGSDPPDFNYYVWTGTQDDGSADPAGSFCNDWTSNASADLGFVGNSEENVTWAGLKPRPCYEKARIYCMSELSASAPIIPPPP